MTTYGVIGWERVNAINPGNGARELPKAAKERQTPVVCPKHVLEFLSQTIYGCACTQSHTYVSTIAYIHEWLPSNASLVQIWS